MNMFKLHHLHEMNSIKMNICRKIKIKSKFVYKSERIHLTSMFIFQHNGLMEICNKNKTRADKQETSLSNLSGLILK